MNKPERPVAKGEAGVTTDRDAQPSSAIPGRYLLIDVPNFNQAKGEELPMRSYLRLGAADPRVAGKKEATDWGEDLAVRAKKETRIDAVDGSWDSAQRSEAFASEMLLFEDDARRRDPEGPVTLPFSDAALSVEERKAESDRIHTKGGWRDHSDGNRVSTTRGDKVEVIRGNYKLVVLGRQKDDEEGVASGFDLSGGEIREMGMNIGEFETTSVEWVEDDGGRYRCVEKNQKGDSFSIYWGDVHEEYFGEHKTDVTGSETPESYPIPVVDGTDAWSKPSKVNPKIISRTWAESIEEYTGSAKKRVPSIKEETWAERIDELTNVLLDTNGITIVGGGVAETTTIGGASAETTIIGGAAAETTVIGGLSVETTIVGALAMDIGITGTDLGLSISGSSTELSICPATTDLHIGDTMEMQLGNPTEMLLGNSLGVQVGDKAELQIGNAIDTLIGSKVEIMLGPAADIHLGFKLEVHFGGKKDINDDKEEVAAEHNKTAGTHEVNAGELSLN